MQDIPDEYAGNPAMEHIEFKIAFLERANMELSDVVYRQQQELEELRARLSALVTQLESLKSEDFGDAVEEERPPHY
jgi:uncharacterized coiled-coil protein SlyX